MRIVKMKPSIQNGSFATKLLSVTTNLISLCVCKIYVDHYASNVTFSTDTHRERKKVIAKSNGYQKLQCIKTVALCSTDPNEHIFVFVIWKMTIHSVRIELYVPLSIQSVGLSINSGHIKYVFISHSRSIIINNFSILYTRSVHVILVPDGLLFFFYLSEAVQCIRRRRHVFLPLTIFQSFFIVFKFKSSSSRFHFVQFGHCYRTRSRSLSLFLFYFLFSYASHRLIICSGVELCEWWMVCL